MCNVNYNNRNTCEEWAEMDKEAPRQETPQIPGSYSMLKGQGRNFSRDVRGFVVLTT